MMENSLPAEYSSGSEIPGSVSPHEVRAPHIGRPVILIVEDEAILAEDIKEVLEEYGYRVCAIAQTGEQALSGFFDFQPDLILMDINLPGNIDGIEAAARITKNFPVPIVYLTAFSDGETITRATKTNPYGFLVKPFRKETVHSTIQVALAKNRLDTDIRNSREWIDLTFRNIDRGIIVIDTDGRIALVNSFTERLLGIPFSTLHRNLFEDEIRLHDAIFDERYIPSLVSVFQEGLISIIPSDIILINGFGNTFRIMEGAFSPISDEQGSIHGVMFTFKANTRPAKKSGFKETPLIATLEDANTSSPFEGSASLQNLRIQELKGDITMGLSLEKANLCILLGKFEEAVLIYEKMLTTDLHNFQIWHNLGVVQTKLGRHREALRSFERALAANPASGETLRLKTEVRAILSMKKRRS
jgi:CheY-like chemotaxis protein/tetratricopeptide (TPR) repeat protein